MKVMIITISVVAVLVVIFCCLVIAALVHDHRMAKYYEFQAELEAKEDEWERIRRM